MQFINTGNICEMDSQLHYIFLIKISTKVQ
uniref:Uncharacterized protein n=1 Tax=Anguilla anguilla TaxID=7936 RepID=A0A0E9XZ37_ANGAN